MFQNALIATDMGESQDRFMCCKEGLKTLGVRHIVVAVCIRLHETQGLRDSVETFFRTELEHRKAALEQMGYTVALKILAGEPSIEVNRLADETNCSLIVVGSKLQGLAGRVFWTGVGAELLSHCQKPLLVLRGPADSEGMSGCPLVSPKRILFPTDFSENAEHAFASLTRLVEGGITSVVLMHVQDSRKIDPYLADRLEEFNAIDRGRLERMKDALTNKGADEVQIELSFGHPIQEILRRIRQGDISLVLMGSQGRGFISEVFLGSVSHNIARHAAVPVLLWPAVR